METTIAPTNVISFEYSNGNDFTPTVLVTSVEADYVCGYNLGYYVNGNQDSMGKCYRKYSRIYMDNIVNHTDDVINLSKKKVSLSDKLYACANAYSEMYNSLDNKGIIEKDIFRINQSAVLVEKKEYAKAARNLESLDTIVRDCITDEVWTELSELCR